MNETTMTIVGNVLNEPECRVLEESQHMVTNFRVAATSRRYDRHQERWVDGDTLRLRVTCWRQLADNVFRSVHVGDPVIITGRLSSRNWETDDHVKRVAYELEAAAVGHDLTRGRARFARVRANTLTSVIDDELAESRIAGRPSTPVTELNSLPRHQDYDATLGGFVTTVEERPATERDPFAEDILEELDSALSAAFDTGAFPGMAALTAPADASALTTPADASALLASSTATGAHPMTATIATDDVEDATDDEDGDGPETGASLDGTSPDEPTDTGAGRRKRTRGRMPVPV